MSAFSLLALGHFAGFGAAGKTWSDCGCAKTKRHENFPCAVVQQLSGCVQLGSPVEGDNRNSQKREEMNRSILCLLGGAALWTTLLFDRANWHSSSRCGFF